MSGFIKSKSESFLTKKMANNISALQSVNIYPTNVNAASGIPQVSALMARSVSEYRRDLLSEEVKQGLFRDGSGPSSNEDGMTTNAIVSASVGMHKNAQVVSGAGYRGGNGDVVKQTPEVYSPLWLNSNLNLPRDRATINAWCRSFYALNPFVQNAINLHSTYPISKLNIKCQNKDIEKFFNDMVEEIDLMNICVQIAQEYWLLGESFVYAELDESKGKWSRLLIQNPDYMVVKRTVVADEPVIMLRPDENLKKVVTSNRPSDIEQKKQLNQHIIDCVKRGENIPLDNLHISHLARRISPYEIRGTGLPVCIFRQLMLFDKLRECYDDQTEVLTDHGFKKIFDLIEESSNINIGTNNINGAIYNEDGSLNIIKTKDNFKIACVNAETNKVEYHAPIDTHMSKYNGKMVHFTGKKVDCLVTPNHKMWASEKTNGKWTGFSKIKANEFLTKKKSFKFQSQINFENTNEPKHITVCGKEVQTELYLKVLGYLVAEGCVYSNFENGRYDALISVNQLTTSDCYHDMKEVFVNFADKINKNANNCIRSKGTGYSENSPKQMWSVSIHGKDIVEHFKNEIGTNNNTLSAFKHLPRWIFDLSPRLLNILLEALVKGDGTEQTSKYGTDSKNYKYSTISKQLADDVYEIVYKLGFVPNICVSTAKKSDDRIVTEYIVMWSDTNYGNYPNINTCEKHDNNGGGARILEEDYDGIVWCFEVPTGLFITRRNGKITIQGNSKYAQADNMVNPLTLIKIGSADFKPTFADLEAWKNIFECHDEETEVLTSSGFKKFNEVIDYEESTDTVINCKPKDNVKIACFNPDTEGLEYHEPSRATLYNYDGDMYHFANEKFDIKVTPNHDMWVSKRKNIKNSKHTWDKWEKVKAEDLSINNYYKFRSCANWKGNDQENIEILGKQVPAKLYMEFLGYLLSEGSIYKVKTQRNYYTSICQSTKKGKYYDDMFKCINDFSYHIGDTCYHSVGNDGMWQGSFRNKELYDYLKEEIGVDGNTKSSFKHVPRNILSMSKELLSILLDSLVKGDGSNYSSRVNKLKYCRYTTTSEQLANDVCEIAFKCGYAPIVKKCKLRANRLQAYTIAWSEDNKGKGYFPVLHRGKEAKNTKNTNPLLIEKYNGKIWCVTVPTGLFITRRNGKITIQGNSAQYDKDFKVFTHEGVTVERVGYGSGIYDISGDVTQIIKEIYTGLQVPSVLMDGGADTTYANGSVALDVVRQRYMQFRNMMAAWLKRKIFAPISKIQGFYDYSGGEKQLIVPDVDWNHMSLFDTSDYINNLTTLSQGTDDQKRVSLHTLYRSMGLEFSDEVRKLRTETIQNAIAKKEKLALDSMDLNSLRSLDEDDEIPEPATDSVQAQPLPGEMPGGGAGGGLPGLDMGGLSMPPSMPPAPSGGGPIGDVGGGAGAGAPPAP